MKYIDYHFDITEHGIEFTDKGTEALHSDHIKPGMILKVELIGEDNRLFLRVIDSDTLDYYMYV